MLFHESKDFNDAVLAVSNSKNILPSFLIKDYWVTEILRALQNSKFKNTFVFKGGTSLFKVFGLINRFSEDVDLLFISESYPSNTGKKKALKELKEFIATIKDIEFDQDNSGNFSADDHRSAYFKYPAVNYTGVRPYILIEAGFRGSPTSSTLQHVQSMLGKYMFELNPNYETTATNLCGIDVLVLDPFRTLIEKVFSLHRAYYQEGLEKKERHFYDIYCLLNQKYIVEKLGTEEHKKIKEDVAECDRKYFNNDKIPEDLSFSDSPAFAKFHKQYDALKSTYKNSELYYGERPDFDVLMDRIIKFKSLF